jgi:DNA topoisomerase IB
MYHADWTSRRHQQKFDRMLQFAARLPRARLAVTEQLGDTGLSRERVLPTAFRMLDLGYFRIGGESYAAENGSYGLTTLLRSHVRRTGDTLVFRTAGAGGWGDPLDRDPQLVLRDVLRDLVSREVALRDYGVVLEGRAVDRAATTAERARLSEQRGPIQPFDFGHAPSGGSA